jgi:hypothetical protein
MLHQKFDRIITIGDSWTWGSELLEDQRISNRFDTLLAKYYSVECINLARTSASNFCYKWHWIDWLSLNPSVNDSLVIVGVTGPNRHLIYNNQASFFQESPGRLVSEEIVHANWGNGPGAGGFIRAFPNYIDFPDPTKKQCQDNFYRYNYDDKMAEILTIWEINLLDLMIKQSGGIPIFWSNFHPYDQISLPWAKQVLKDCNLVNGLQPFKYSEDCFFGPKSHPNVAGHQHIVDVLQQFISG